jgi:hypothetical protein
MMSENRLARSRPPIAAILAAGALLFALGLVLARARLPEWRLGALPDPGALTREYRTIAASCGLRLAAGGPAWELCESSRRKRLRNEEPLTSTAPAAALAIRVEQDAVTPLASPSPHGLTLKVWFDAAGRARSIDARPSGSRGALANILRATAPPAGRPLAFATALLAPGERLGRPIQLFFAEIPLSLYPIAGSSPPEHVTVGALGMAVEASRNPGAPEAVVAQRGSIDVLAGAKYSAVLECALIVIAGVFGFLAIRRRVSLANAGWLAALACLALLPRALHQPSAGHAAAATALLVVESLWLAVLWAAGESLWRTGDPRFDTTLDQLRAHRLTARAGRALLCGFGLGAAAAGLGLAAYALATWLPGSQAQALSVALPATDGVDGPLAAGITCAAVIAFLLACGRRIARRRWVAVAVALAGALILFPVKLEPWPVELASNALVVGALIAAAELGGLTALLAASLVAWLLPVAAFSLAHLPLLSGSFLLTAGAAALLLAAGAIGAWRPQAEEAGMARPPAFMLRLERERRLEVEMELLARMQLGLLPSHPPAVPGWEIAARSLIADRAGGDLYDFVPDRAGRWWIAAGDVAGHGFSCAISQAMVKAALASLLGDGCTPGEVLAETDRVLRTAAASRSFTSLALLRLDPATGEALFANAGHPYPLLAVPGTLARDVALPGLPLGQGPRRQYADLPLVLVPGAVLVFCSDGLFEAAAAGAGEDGAPYGYDRPRLLLDTLAGRSAAETLDALLADWRRHRGAGASDDDTTIVVLRRLPADGIEPAPR